MYSNLMFWESKVEQCEYSQRPHTIYMKLAMMASLVCSHNIHQKEEKEPSLGGGT